MGRIICHTCSDENMDKDEEWWVENDKSMWAAWHIKDGTWPSIMCDKHLRNPDRAEKLYPEG